MAAEKQEDVQARFDVAVAEGVSPCMWIPPEWDKLSKSTDLTKRKKQFTDNSADDEFFGVALVSNAAIQDRERRSTEKKDFQPPWDLPGDQSWPSPFADTTHADETEFSSKDFELIEALLPGQVKNGLRGEDVLAKITRIVGPGSPGMRRLGRIFEWTLCRTSVLMGGLNNALKDENSYKTMRDNYVNFLRDLDDHEPEKGPKQSPREQKEKRLGRPMELKPDSIESASGYGRAIKWTCIDPVIFRGVIVGTRVVVKWNPHISSSGIAINHD